MFGLDEGIAALADGGPFLLVTGVAILLGLRHATDPDHLTAVSTLVASGHAEGTTRAAALGSAWGLGHATTLVLLGLPIVLFDHYLPEPAQQAAEVAIGILIIALAVRLLLQWRRGRFHAHAHRHGGEQHRHLHGHGAGAAHEHRHDPPRTRSRWQAYGIGLLHGIGGSAGVGVLLLAAIPDQVQGVAALLVFALFTAVSMTIASTAFGYALGRAPVRRRFARLAPTLGSLSLAFGAWYALGALEAVPYYL